MPPTDLHPLPSYLTTFQPPRPLPSHLTTLQYAAMTRYVVPASPAQILAGGEPFMDIQDAADQHLFPGIQFLPEGARTIQQWAQQIEYPRNTPETDWHWDFSFWIVRGGLNPDHPSPWYKNPCPTAEMLSTNVTTLAVYDLNGGPKVDTPAWLIQAWDLDQVTPMGGDFFNVVTDPSLNVRANSGIVDTPVDEDIEARAQVGFYHFSHWSIDGVPWNPKTQLASRHLKVAAHTSGRARAWYSVGAEPGITPPPETYDPWWWIRTHRGLTPPPPAPPWSKLQRQFDMAVTIASLAGGLAPELHSGALDLAFKQASITTGSIKKTMKSSGDQPPRAGKRRTGRKASR